MYLQNFTISDAFRIVNLSKTQPVYIYLNGKICNGFTFNPPCWGKEKTVYCYTCNFFIIFTSSLAGLSWICQHPFQVSLIFHVVEFIAVLKALSSTCKEQLSMFIRQGSSYSILCLFSKSRNFLLVEGLSM